MDNTDEQVPEGTPIWRYMDIARFVLLLSTRTLWFAKGETLHAGDPFEGYGRATAFTNEAKPGTYAAADGIALMYAEVGHLAAKTLNNAPKHQFVSSWCHGSESLAMWMLYGMEGRGVAIRSSVGMFMGALKRDLSAEHYRFGKVRYHESVEAFQDAVYDFRTGPIYLSGNLWQRTLALAFNKRSAYAYEHEWRAAIYQDADPKVFGLDVPCDLAGLIGEVYVGPQATALEISAVASLMKNWGIAGKPIKSQLLAAPKRARSGRYVRSPELKAAAARAEPAGGGGGIVDRTAGPRRRGGSSGRVRRK